jgi:hypothetical protein
VSDDELRDEEQQPAGEAAKATEAVAAGEDAPPATEDAPAAEPAGASRGSPRSGAGLRLLGAAFTLPWLIFYGITGAWAVTRGAKAAADGLKQLDVGYTRFVTPAQVIFFGALLLTAFTVMMACALLLLYGRRSAMVWLPLLLVAAGLTAGSIWASVRGDLHPILWVSLFFGLAYVTVVALVRVLQVTRAERRGTIGSP